MTDVKTMINVICIEIKWNIILNSTHGRHKDFVTILLTTKKTTANKAYALMMDKKCMAIESCKV